MVLRLEFVRSVEKHSKIWKEVLIMTPRLQEKYTNEVIQAMTEKFGYKNIMEVPKLEKIVINMGVGEAKDNQISLKSWISRMPPRTSSLCWA